MIPDEVQELLNKYSDKFHKIEINGDQFEIDYVVDNLSDLNLFIRNLSEIDKKHDNYEIKVISFDKKYGIVKFLAKYKIEECVLNISIIEYIIRKKLI